MKIVVFGLTVSSSWGNGHATLWRGLCKALAQQHCRVVFFERDVPYYAASRDLYDLPGGELVLYSTWREVANRAAQELRDADAAVVTSYCPDGIAAADLVLSCGRLLRVFYDLDTPVTLAAVRSGESLPYLRREGLRGFDLVLSFTGGKALSELRNRLGARLVVPLYGHVDPETHRKSPPQPQYQSDLNYLGTYAPDRQDALKRLFLEPARQRADWHFLIAGAQYPTDFPWSSNIYFVRHLPPAEHAAFFCSARLTLNLTRAAMARMGWCPSGRLFEATACGAAVLSDCWDGIDAFFRPGTEILLASSATDVMAALDTDDSELLRIGRAGRERTLDEHTSRHRAEQLIAAFELARANTAAPQMMEA